MDNDCRYRKLCDVISIRTRNSHPSLKSDCQKICIYFAILDKFLNETTS